MLGGSESKDMSRTPEIMADAVYALVSRESKSTTGKFFIDEELLVAEGIKDFTQYACNPGNDNVGQRLVQNHDFFFEMYCFVLCLAYKYCT